MPLTTLFIDLNSYFASCEQQLHPELRGRPVAVVPVETDSTSCIAASYEAKKFGVKTGTNVGEAKRMCPGLICVHGRHTHYIRMHHEILAAAETVLPVRAVHSIDEFSCRLLSNERSPEQAEKFALEIKQAIATRVGECMKCSIGIAPNRLLAKVGSDMQKPDGLITILNEDLPHALYQLQLIDLPGIGPRMQRRLNERGVDTVEELCALPVDRMRDLWESVLGEWWFHALRGEDLRDAKTVRRSISHQHVLPPDLRNEPGARSVAVRLTDKAATRARHLAYWARRLTVSVRFLDRRSWAQTATFPECHDTPTLVETMLALWNDKPAGPMLRVGIVLDDLAGVGSATGVLFDAARERESLSKAMDAINTKFGKNAVYLGAMHDARDTAKTRIAFHSIPDLDLPDADDEVDDVG